MTEPFLPWKIADWKGTNLVHAAEQAAGTPFHWIAKLLIFKRI